MIAVCLGLRPLDMPLLALQTPPFTALASKGGPTWCLFSKSMARTC